LQGAGADAGAASRTGAGVWSGMPASCMSGSPLGVRLLEPRAVAVASTCFAGCSWMNGLRIRPPNWIVLRGWRSIPAPCQTVARAVMPGKPKTGRMILEKRFSFLRKSASCGA
jgi:hypothetical protein